MKKFALVLFLCMLIFSSTLWGQEVPKPLNGRFVHDFGNILDPNTEVKLEEALTQLHQKTTAQLALVTVPTIDPMTIEEYANTLFNRWGIGNKELNNGVLAVLAVKERKMRIEVGYGLEGAINDGAAGTILRTIAPDLKKDDYNTAFTTCTNLLIERVAAEYKQELETVPVPKKKTYPIKLIIFLIIVAILVICRILSTQSRDLLRRKRKFSGELQKPGKN